jgi:hypothetical protein
MTAVRMMITPPRTPPTITPSVVELGEVLCGEEDYNDGAEVGLVTTKIVQIHRQIVSSSRVVYKRN